MNCRLCTREVAIVASHIIPEFLYQALYDGKHRFIQISVAESEGDRFKQKGLREPLLCEPCEQRISVYEDYLRRLLRGGVSFAMTPDGQHLRLSDLDYPRLKLFQLSVLWRAGISSLDPFAEVKLGPHEEPIRRMLLSNDPGQVADYGCIMSVLQNDGQMLEGLMVPPTRARLAGQKAYRFVFGGLVFVYPVASAPPPQFVVEAFAQPDGTALVRRQEIKEMGICTARCSRMRSFTFSRP